MLHTYNSEALRNSHNASRFFTEKRQVGLVFLVGVLLWGVYGYTHMPKRKDPEIPVRVAVAVCPWPGVNAEQVEQLVTRQIEATIAQDAHVHPADPSSYGIRSITLPGLAIVYVQLADGLRDTKKEFSDINLKLDTLSQQLPQGAGPIRFNSDFGDTVALMLTLASPPASQIEIELRARDIKKAIAAARPAKIPGRLSFIYSFPQSVTPDVVRRPFMLFADAAEKEGLVHDVRYFGGDGFIGFDAASGKDDGELLKYADWFIHERLQRSEIHADAWQPTVIRDPEETEARLAAVRGAKYSYRELDDFTDLIARSLLGVPQTSRVDRSGVLPEQIYLDYSQPRLAAYGLQPQKLKDVLAARNIALPGGSLEAAGKNVIIDPSGQFKDTASIGDVILGKSPTGAAVYLRDLAEISRGYQAPAKFLNFYSWRDAQGTWRRSAAITLGVQMKPGEQIDEFGKNVDERLAGVLKLLPEDLIVSRTSDQPKQVKEKIDLFMQALYEAVVLVVLVSLLGFWEWRSALLMALSIPVTLALTFGMMHLLRIDIQQISIASLIIALGLLVDDPIVATDAIKRSLADGEPRLIAAWLGPTKLARAIMYATVTNVVAYLPLLMLRGIVGEFIFSLPIVIGCSLVASRIVSMTFIPLLGFYLLRPNEKRELDIEERRSTGFSGRYYRLVQFAIQHRWRVALASCGFLMLGFALFAQLKPQFFPDDVQYWAYLDIWLPNDAPLAATNETAREVENVVVDAAAKFDRDHARSHAGQPELLKSLTTFVGGGGPRFWFSVSPELPQLNYAEIVLEIRSKDEMPALVDALQEAVNKAVPGAYVDVRQLQNTPVEVPVEIRISAQADTDPQRSAADILTLRTISGKVERVLSSVPSGERVRDDWFAESSKVRLSIDPDRANLAGVTNLDVAISSTTAISGGIVTTLREGNKDIPVVARLRMEERSRMSDIQSLYVYSSADTQRVPLALISNVEITMGTERIRRLEHFRTISVRCFPAPGFLPSQVLKAALPGIRKIRESLPPGYSLQIGGDYAKQKDGFGDLAVALSVSVFAIFLALVMQFNHAVKPLLVFAAVPYGIAGAAAALFVTHTPFGFMAFLGITSLIGVIVSHVIVLFDFIEEMHEKGEPVEQALADAGIVRLRPVLITVGATVLALFPLALHGGPLWRPLCFAQIGGLFAATFITLLLVPVLYAIFVLDLKVVGWPVREPTARAALVGKE